MPHNGTLEQERVGRWLRLSGHACLPQRNCHAQNSKEPTNSTATCWPHNLQWQHTFTIAALAILRTAARNHVLGAYKHHLGTPSHSAHHYRLHTRVQKIHDHPLTYWNATTFLTSCQVSPTLFNHDIPQTEFVTTAVTGQPTRFG